MPGCLGTAQEPPERKCPTHLVTPQEQKGLHAGKGSPILHCLGGSGRLDGILELEGWTGEGTRRMDIKGN